MSIPIPSDAVRQYIYHVVIIAAPLLVGYGIVDPSMVGLWLQVAGAVLGVGTSSLAAVALAQQRKAAKVAPVAPPVTAADVDKAISDALHKAILGDPAPTVLEPLPAGAALLPPGPQFGTVAMSVPGVIVQPESSAAPVTSVTSSPAETFKPDVAPRKSRVFVTPKSPVVAPIAPAPATKPVPDALAAAWKLDATGTQ